MSQERASGTGARRSPRPAPLPRGLRLRLTVAIPLVVAFLVMLSGFLTLWISYPLFFQGSRPVAIEQIEQRVQWAFLAVGGFTLVSLWAAIALARSIAGPLRALTSRIESLRGSEGNGSGAAHTEIGALGSALEEVEDSFSSLKLESDILRSLEGGVLTADRQGLVTSLNAVAESILGTTAREALGQPLTRLVPDERPNRSFLSALTGALAGTTHPSSAETTIVTPGGRAIDLGYTISTLRDEGGRSIGIVLTFKDLAERKSAEQVMRRAEDLALLGTMATGVAHEIRNPLAAMNGLVELLCDSLPADSPRRHYGGRMLQCIERINRICQELLTVGRPEPRDIEPLDLNDLVRSTLELLRYDDANQDIPVHENYAPDLPRVPGDRERLSQVVLNILRNAFQACKDGGEITIASRREDGVLAVDIGNTGPPIPPDIQRKLFTLFFTTKKRGTGVGLAISQHLVRAHGGRLRVDSGPQRGTTFTIELPVAGPAPAPAEETVTHTAPMGA